MTILVTGADGQLGRCLRRADKPGGHRYVFTDVADLDITSAAAVERAFALHRPDVVVNCAAYTAVDRAEAEPEKARALNALAPATLAAAAARCGAAMVQISTDYVFGGTANTPIAEDAAPAPASVYGATKLEGERLARQAGCPLTVVRTAWLYSEFGHNFAKTMAALTASRPEVRVVADQVGTPTYAQDLADALVAMMAQGLRPGTYHYTDQGVCSWYDFAHAVARLAGNGGCRVRPCRTADYPTAAARPAYSVLDKSKIVCDYGLEIPHWTASLEKCMANLRGQI